MGHDDVGAQSWIDQGREAGGAFRFEEAAECFEKASAIDPESIEAHLGLGVACACLYVYGATEAQNIKEQNETNGKRAEEHLQKALELDPRQTRALEYLATLYSHWLAPEIDVYGKTRHSRIADAQHSCRRLIEIDPQNSFAHYAWGVIGWRGALELMLAFPSYPRMNDDDRRILGAQTAPLLDESYAHLLRALEIDLGNSMIMRYLAAVKRAQSSVAATAEARDWAEEEALAWDLKSGVKVFQSTVTITFHPVDPASRPASEPIGPRFPPDPEMLIPPAPPPPPPARKLTIAE
jgi:tetratricopeptide (TPR) repeat protein